MNEWFHDVEKFDWGINILFGLYIFYILDLYVVYVILLGFVYCNGL